MNPDLPSLESELRQLQAPLLDDAFLARLEAATDGSLTNLTAEELQFEKLLRRTSPTALSPQLMADLETIVRHVPFAINEKIVLFPNGSQPVQPSSNRFMWRAAAAVAMIGAISAFFIPTPNNRPGPALAKQQPSVAPAVTPNPQNFVPASFNRGLTEVHDEGVVWKSNNQPHSVVRVVYKDQITLKDHQGRTVEVEQPRVEYMLVPTKAD